MVSPKADSFPKGELLYIYQKVTFPKMVSPKADPSTKGGLLSKVIYIYLYPGPGLGPARGPRRRGETYWFQPKAYWFGPNRTYWFQPKAYWFQPKAYWFGPKRFPVLWYGMYCYTESETFTFGLHGLLIQELL